MRVRTRGGVVAGAQPGSVAPWETRGLPHGSSYEAQGSGSTRSFRDHSELPRMEGELASWDLRFASTKFCTCRLRPLRRHTSPASAALWGPVQPAPVPPSGSHRAARALTAHPGFPGGARTRAPSLQPSFGRSPGTGSGHPAVVGGWLAPNVRILELSLPLERRDGRAEAVPAACAARAGLHLRSGPVTTSPRPSGARLTAERCKVGASAGEVPPRPHVAAARGAVPRAREGR